MNRQGRDAFDFVVTTDEGATFTPWTDGWAVGYLVQAEGHRPRYVYLNPSGGTDTGDLIDSDVFVYHDEDHAKFDTVFYINIWNRDVRRQGHRHQTRPGGAR